jgi:hypothetical protein
MKNQLNLTDKKRDELLNYFKEDNTIQFEKVIEIIFDIYIPPNYRYLPDNYPFEIRRCFLRLNSVIVLSSDLARQHYQIKQKLLKLEVESSNENDEVKELMKKSKELEKAITPLISQLLELIKNIKESGFDTSKN